jgi:anti-sigma regulatory factor (Ser/Thr protein kinase)
VTRLSVAADDAGVLRAVRAVRAFAAGCALAERHADRLAVVVEEWVSNVAEHGAPPRASRVTIRLECAGAQVRLTLSDAGCAFDPRGAGFEGPNVERGGGAGLELVRAWAEIADYRRTRARNRVVLLVATP